MIVGAPPTCALVTKIKLLSASRTFSITPLVLRFIQKRAPVRYLVGNKLIRSMKKSTTALSVAPKEPATPVGTTGKKSEQFLATTSQTAVVSLSLM